MPKRKPTKHEDDILRNIRQPDRYDPKARSFGGPWRMVKCKDGAYVCYEQHLEIIDNLRKNAEIDSAQSSHDGIHTCSKGCSKPGCNRSLRDTIEEQDAQIEALKQDILEKAAELRRLHQERVHDLNQIGGLQEENQSLAGQVRQFEEHRDTAAQIIKRLTAELSNISGWGRGLESDLSHARVEISFLKSEVERYKFTLEEERQIARQDWAGLRCEHDRVKRALEQAEAEVERLRASSFVTAVPVEQYERLRKAGDAMAACITEFRCGKYGNALDKVGGFYVWQDWLKAKEGKQP